MFSRIQSHVFIFVLLLWFAMTGVVSRAQGTAFPVTVTDQTPLTPLANPIPTSYGSRYVSGFGLDDSFTLFFEDRDNGGAISFVQTTSGPTGFPAAVTATNIPNDTHFVIKPWPINIGGTTFNYRAWASVGNNPQHRFYVSNDLINWTLQNTFTIPNAATFTTARGQAYYGFHDVVLLNGTYYAFSETNQGQTVLVRSANGDHVWEAFDSVGGTLAADGPLYFDNVTYGAAPTPSGSFFDLGFNRGYGKIHIPGDDSHMFLAINTAARANLSAAALEAAFIDPSNWTWNDGSTGSPSPSIALLSGTAEHDIREAWFVPQSDPNEPWTIMYTADFGAAADGDKALGWIGVLPPIVQQQQPQPTAKPKRTTTPTPARFNYRS